MRNALSTICLFILPHFVLAQEQLPAERAQQAAKIIIAHVEKIDGLQLKVAVDADKATGLKKGEIGALVIPDKNLYLDRVAKAGKEIVPIAQLWTKGLTTLTSDNPTAKDKLRLEKVKAKDEEVELSLLLLGVRKSADNKLELVVFAKGKEPLHVLPLEANEKNQDQPVELDGKGEGGRGTLFINILGKHQAKLPIAAQGQ